jgi:hypothetical protein
MRCICGHEEEEHAKQAGCGIGSCSCFAYRQPTKKLKKIQKLVDKLNDLQEQRKEISKEINELNARLRRIATFDEWYEGKGIDIGILDSIDDAMNIFWDAAADQSRHIICYYDNNVEPDYDPSPEQIFITCLHFLDAHLEALTGIWDLSKGDPPGGWSTEPLTGYKNLSVPVLKVVDAIQELPEIKKLMRVKKLE